MKNMPLHPGLAHFPLVLWALLPLWDGLAIFQKGTAPWWAIGYWTALAGLILAVPTMMSGLRDAMRLPKSFTGGRDLSIHVVLMILAFFGALAAMALRHGSDDDPETWFYLIAGIDGIVALLVLIGAWYGGRLVYIHGAGQVKSDTVD